MTDLDTLVTRAGSVGGLERVYKVGHVPGDAEYPYVVLGLSGIVSTLRRDGGPESRSPRRLTAQAFSHTADGVTDAIERADLAFRDKVIGELDGNPYSTREAATPPYRDADDDGVLNITHTYRID